MFSHRKSPLNKISKQASVDTGLPKKHSTNPFDNDSELDKQRVKPARASSDPARANSDSRADLFDLNEVKGTPSSSYSLYSAKSKYKNDFRDDGGFENQSVQELEDYSVYKAEETTKTVNNCLKIAEDIREDATKTLVTLHQQGDQITRTHATAADIDQDLSRGEKLLGSLGGIFSKTWKPKKNRHIVGPVTFRDDPVLRKGNHLEQREKLGLSSAPKGQSNGRAPHPEPTNAMQKVEVEKTKQDDSLSDLSNLLGELKHMAEDMGSEIERHNKLLKPVEDDVEELNFRVKGANQRARKLLGK
ncbi:hypothetical protein DCAR_0518969 [Daucus carota subsp. sativus]|uniref:Uncharacterized protein n=1 Tax=Daucus carota subsp. sativus TaxID=79200 RepID=A0A164XM42_DAUCS|nr:PREDICTED: SNAP25 homologous protein SNAP33 [Daucus carota subsp. sativus]WOG99616.1 hypothetical protein DCAR_0518969 [Daucus carota subsp. sativus]